MILNGRKSLAPFIEMLNGKGGAARGRARKLGFSNGFGPLPEAWQRADVVSLWQWEASAQEFVEQPRPGDFPATFLMNIATPELRIFRPKRANGRALLVMPGGAYKFISILNEGVDIAEVFTETGYKVFVLTYRLPSEGWSNRADVPLRDAQRAMRIIRHRASEFDVRTDQIGALGFSAGGHLAASLLTSFDEQVYDKADAADHLSARPDWGGLIYPVVSLVPPFCHPLSSECLLGNSPTKELICRRSPVEHVANDTPPIFLVHALDDPEVPAGNSLLMAEALKAANRPHELHLFEEGGHGFGLGPVGTPVRNWSVLFGHWMDRKFEE